MSHEVETMMYAGETPWHGLGKKVDQAVTAEEAIREAGLDWEVKLVPVYTSQPGKKIPNVKVSGKYAVQRQTDGSVYAVVGNYYQPIQNREAFKFFDGVVDSGEVKYETAGSLRGGARIWILSRMGDSIGVKGDEVEKYLILSNSHDATLALQMFFSPIRVVCNNTLQMALGDKIGQSFYARHTTNIAQKVEVAQEILGFANKYFSDWKEEAERLATQALPAGDVPKLLVAAFQTSGALKVEDYLNQKIYTPLQTEMEKVPVILEQDREEFPVELRGTKWEAFNAVAKYTDYYREYRGADQVDARLNGVWYGGGEIIKKKAWNYLLKS